MAIFLINNFDEEQNEYIEGQGQFVELEIPFPSINDDSVDPHNDPYYRPTYLHGATLAEDPSCPDHHVKPIRYIRYNKVRISPTTGRSSRYSVFYHFNRNPSYIIYGENFDGKNSVSLQQIQNDFLDGSNQES